MDLKRIGFAGRGYRARLEQIGNGNMAGAFGVMVQAHELTQPGLHYVSDAGELLELARDCEIDERDATDVSGAFVIVGDGDYPEIWLTFGSKPYAANAIYFRAK